MVHNTIQKFEGFHLGRLIFLNICFLIPFSSVCENNVIAVDNSSKPAFKNLKEAKKFPHPISAEI